MPDWPLRTTLGRLLVIATLVVAASGCRLRIVVPEGGRVVSESGAYQCEAGQKCNIEVVDIFFRETFRAEPAEGFYFRRWKDGDRHFCASTYAGCALATTGFGGNAALQQILESTEVFFISPLFAPGQCQQVVTTREDGFQHIYREEGQQCSVPGSNVQRHQGPVSSYKDDKLVSLVNWDQGRKHGRAVLYFDDGLTVKEVSAYQDNKYQGQQKLYDSQGRLLLSAHWQAGQLDGLRTSYDYSDAARFGGSPTVTMATYRAGKLDGQSTTTYPDGVWEKREYAQGVQQGLYEVFAPTIGGTDGQLGWRYVYVFVDGLIRYGYAYARYGIPGSDEYREEGGPHSAWVWECPYIDEMLDEETCFRDGLDLGERL